MKKHSKKFLELMQRTEKIDEVFHFTEDEIKFLGDEDLLAFGKKFPDEAHYYITGNRLFLTIKNFERNTVNGMMNLKKKMALKKVYKSVTLE